MGQLCFHVLEQFSQDDTDENYTAILEIPYSVQSGKNIFYESNFASKIGKNLYGTGLHLVANISLASFTE